MFSDRYDAGRQLAALVAPVVDPPVVVLGLARGGVPVAAEVAAEVGAPLDVCVVRKIGLPRHPELGVGALAEGGEPELDEVALARLGLTADDLAAVVERERTELARRVAAYRAGRPPVPLGGAAAVVVDDGLATGGTALSAVRAIRSRGAVRVVLAVPVAAPPSVRRVAAVADEVVCVLAPPTFRSVGEWYADFTQTTDAEVVRLLS